MPVHILEVPFNFGGKQDVLYPAIIQAGAETILVDCGYAGFMPLLEVAASRHGLSLDRLTGVIITHHDIDHMGGLHELKEAFPELKVYALDQEAKYISGKEKSIRLQQAEALYPNLPDDQKEGARYFQELLKSIEPVAVDHTFSPDERPHFLPGVRVLHTPGHMPGHISLYLEEEKVLLAADAVVIEQGQLELANPQFTLDLDLAVASLQKLSLLEIDQLVCYHGGLMREQVAQKLETLIDNYARIIWR